MNLRIQELAEQAGFALWGKETWNPGDVVDWSARYDRELEKFAELIVDECLSCVKWVGEVNKHSVEPVHTAQAITKRIKQRFGAAA